MCPKALYLDEGVLLSLQQLLGCCSFLCCSHFPSQITIQELQSIAQDRQGASGIKLELVANKMHMSHGLRCRSSLLISRC